MNYTVFLCDYCDNCVLIEGDHSKVPDFYWQLDYVPTCCRGGGISEHRGKLFQDPKTLAGSHNGSRSLRFIMKYGTEMIDNVYKQSGEQTEIPEWIQSLFNVF